MKPFSAYNLRKETRRRLPCGTTAAGGLADTFRLESKHSTCLLHGLSNLRSRGFNVPVTANLRGAWNTGMGATISPMSSFREL